jgi:hypothetical protein
MVNLRSQFDLEIEQIIRNSAQLHHKRGRSTAFSDEIVAPIRQAKDVAQVYTNFSRILDDKFQLSDTPSIKNLLTYIATKIAVADDDKRDILVSASVRALTAKYGKFSVGHPYDTLHNNLGAIVRVQEIVDILNQPTKQKVDANTRLAIISLKKGFRSQLEASYGFGYESLDTIATMPPLSVLVSPGVPKSFLVPDKRARNSSIPGAAGHGIVLPVEYPAKIPTVSGEISINMVRNIAYFASSIMLGDDLYEVNGGIQQGYYQTTIVQVLENLTSPWEVAIALEEIWNNIITRPTSNVAFYPTRNTDNNVNLYDTRIEAFEENKNDFISKMEELPGFVELDLNLQERIYQKIHDREISFRSTFTEKFSKYLQE